MVPQNFQVLAKLGLCSNCSHNFSGCSFARARILFYKCSHARFLVKVVFARCSLLVRLTFINARARKEKRCARMLANARKDHSIPLSLPESYVRRRCEVTEHYCLLCALEKEKLSITKCSVISYKCYVIS